MVLPQSQMMFNDGFKQWSFAIVAGALLTLGLFNSFPLFRLPPLIQTDNIITVDFFTWQPPKTQPPAPTQKLDKPVEKLKPVAPVKQPVVPRAVPLPAPEPLQAESLVEKAVVEPQTITPVMAEPQVEETVQSVDEEVEPTPVHTEQQTDEETLPAPVPIFQLTAMPRFAHKVNPLYPVSMRHLGRQAKVKLEVLVDKHGVVRDVSVLDSGGVEFDQAAMEAMKVSTFLPGEVNGKAVAVRLRMPVTFSLK